MLRDASRSQAGVLESVNMTYSVGGSYYCFELRQQAACVATCSSLIAHRLFSDSTVVMWLTGLGRGNISRHRHPPLYAWGEQCGWGVKLATHHPQMPRSWISGISLYFPKKSSSVATVHFWLCRLPTVHLTLQKPNHSWHCNMYFLLWFCIQPEDVFIAETCCWWLINKVVYRLDLCLFYALVLYLL